MHLGCGDGKLVAALGADERFIVQGLDTDAKNVAQARETIRKTIRKTGASPPNGSTASGFRIPRTS